jgi:DNA polymerase-4
VGKVMEGKLEAMGVTSVTDLRRLGLAELERQFGRWGRRLHELSLGIDEHRVEPDRPTLQVSAEDTFEHDLTLDELEPHIRRLAEKTWAGHQRESGRVARTVVLKLKTADFRTLTRSFSPPTLPASAHELAELACALRARVQHPAGTRYRLVGVGLAGFVDRDHFAAQRDLFETAAPRD